MTADTDVPVAGSSRFQTTIWDDLRAAKSSPEALNGVVQRYWRPIYKTIRFGWNRAADEAHDLTQEFFSRVIEDGSLTRADSSRGRFRSFLREALRHFMLKEKRDASRLKRGGGTRRFSLDVAAEDDEAPVLPASAEATPDDLFDRVWAQQVLAESIAALRAELVGEGKDAYFRVFEAYDLAAAGEGTYGALAGELKLRESDVRNYLHETRVRLRRIVLARLGAYSGSPEEAYEEFRSLFGGGDAP